MPGNATTIAARSTRRLYLFGPMRVEQPGSAADVAGTHVQRLLGYLALHPRTAHHRESLTDTLWPDLAPDRARRTLSDTIYRLRSRLGDGWILARSDAVGLGAGDLWVDVWEFDRLAASDELGDVAGAVELYTADLLPAIYDDWADGDRTARRATLVSALARIAADREQGGDLQGALASTRRLIVTEPMHEGGHQAYLRLLGRLGRFGEAATHFEELQRLLHDELGVGPLPETVQIMDRLASEREAVRPQAPDRRPRFVGRVAERSLVLDAIEAAMQGRGGVLGVEGPAGIGKSRLLDEVLAGARWRGATVLASEVREVPAASPLAPLAHALTPLLAGPRRLHVEVSLDPTALAALGEIDPRWGDEALAAPTVQRQADARLAYALRALGAALAETGPLVLALDDVHWAGPALWHGIDALAEGLIRRGGLLVLAYRRPGVEQTAGWDVLREWDRRGTVRFATLRPFGFEEIAELAGEDVDASEVLAATGGLPFYVGRWLEGPDHDGSAGMIRERLAGVAATSRQALDCAAVIGEHVPYRVWVDVSGLAPMALAAIGEELAGEQWMRPSDDGYTFVHDLVRTSVYDAIPPGSRRALHRLAAKAIAVRDPANTRARAYHLDHAGLGPEAAAMYAETGRHDIATLAFRDAIEALGRALALLADDDEARLETSLSLAEACEVVGDREHQRPLLDPIIADARRRGDDAVLLRALLVAGLATGHTDAPRRAEELLTEALEVAARLGDPQSLTLAAYRHADLMGQQGRWREAREGVARALGHARQGADPALLGSVLRMSGIAARLTGDPEACVRWLQEAIEVHRSVGDRPEEISTASNLLGGYYELGAWDELLATADQVLPAARAFGDPSIVGVVRHQQGLAALALGDHRAARAMMNEALAAFGTGERQRLVGLVTNTIGLVAEDEGELDEALVLYRRALDIAQAVGAATESAYASHDLGALLASVGRPAEAIPLLRSALATWEQQGNRVPHAKSQAHLALALIGVGDEDEASQLADAGLAVVASGVPSGEVPQGWLWALHRALVALGRHDDADGVLDAARQEIERQARMISDVTLRHQFRERVPLNRAILAEAADRLAPSPDVPVRLARANAPLGRRLRPGETVELTWTLHSPADETIAGKAERRRHRLRRLLAEAAEHGAAPTDDDLARALGVSRRTILRDMEALGDEPVVAATRRRSRTHPAPVR